MTVNELVEWCAANKISLDTHIAIRAKDDYFLVDDNVYLDQAYFGNCIEGTEWEEDVGPRDENGDIDYDNMPKVLILDSGNG